MSEDGIVGGGSRKGDLSKGRVEREDGEDGVPAIGRRQAEDSEHALDFDVRVRGPKGDVISVLVRNA